MVEKTALTAQELEEKLKDMAPEWKTGKNEKGVPLFSGCIMLQSLCKELILSVKSQRLQKKIITIPTSS